VTLRTATREELARYVAGGEPLDKAGAYAFQGEGRAFVARVEGSESNVIGLPLDETLALLACARAALASCAQRGDGAKVIKMNAPDALAALRERVRAAAARAGRDPGAVTLLGVAKGTPSQRVIAAVRAGLADVAENYLQEAAARRAELAQSFAESGAALPRWHFVGRLQRNKARRVVELFDVVHTLDRDELGESLERHAEALGRPLAALVQVNTSGEARRVACRPTAMRELLARRAEPGRTCGSRA
jgi:hypothetical protein